MSEKYDDVVENLTQLPQWIRILIMIGFAFVLYFVLVPAIIVLMVAQALFTVFTGASNRNLRGLASVVSQYVSQIVSYITYNSDQQPFPFSEFPEEESPIDVEMEKSGNEEPKSSANSSKPKEKTKKKELAESESSVVKKAAKKAPAKKKAAKKKPAAKKAVTEQEAETGSQSDTPSN